MPDAMPKRVALCHFLTTNFILQPTLCTIFKFILFDKDNSHIQVITKLLTLSAEVKRCPYSKSTVVVLARNHTAVGPGTRHTVQDHLINCITETATWCQLCWQNGDSLVPNMCQSGQTSTEWLLEVQQHCLWLGHILDSELTTRHCIIKLLSACFRDSRHIRRVCCWLSKEVTQHYSWSWRSSRPGYTTVTVYWKDCRKSTLEPIQHVRNADIQLALRMSATE